MNERNSSEKPKKLVPSGKLDRWVDATGHSYDEAFRHFGIESSDQVDFSDDPDYIAAVTATKDSEQAAFASIDDSASVMGDLEQGPSLSLVGRAHALDTIMRQFNQENKAGGADFSRDYNGMESRYGNNIDEVIGNMHSKASRMGNRAIVALDVLSNGDSGIPMPAGIDYSGSIESDLRRNFGPGVAYARDRNKMLTRVYKSARTKRPK